MNRRSFLRAAFGCAIAPKYPDPRVAANWFIAPSAPAVFFDHRIIIHHPTQTLRWSMRQSDTIWS